MDYNIQISADESNGLIVKNSNDYTYGSFKLSGLTTVYMSYSGTSLTIITPVKGEGISNAILSIGLVNGCTYSIIYANTGQQFTTKIYKDATTSWSSLDGTCNCNIFDINLYPSKIPEYAQLTGLHMSTNSLNNISLVLPCYLFTKASPSGLSMWEYLGTISALGAVSMYNMGDYHIAQSSYDKSGDKYVCCSLAPRNRTYYAGIAVKLTDRLAITEDDTGGIPSIQ